MVQPRETADDAVTQRLGQTRGVDLEELLVRRDGLGDVRTDEPVAAGDRPVRLLYELPGADATLRGSDSVGSAAFGWNCAE